MKSKEVMRIKSPEKQRNDEKENLRSRSPKEIFSRFEKEEENSPIKELKKNVYKSNIIEDFDIKEVLGDINKKSNFNSFVFNLRSRIICFS